MIPRRFEEQVSNHGRRPALRDDGTTSSYIELNRAANRVAHALARDVARQQVPIAVVTSEMRHAVAAIVGVFKARNLCLPMDASVPASRLAAIAAGAGAAAVLTSRATLALAREVSDGRCPVLAVDTLDASLPDSNPEIEVRGEDLACLLYTSGSTGTPKGVVHDHINLRAPVEHWSSRFGFNETDRFVHLSPLSHVSAINDMLKPLLNGACMVPLNLGGSSLGRLAGIVVDERITVLHCIPSVFRAMARALEPDTTLPHLRLVHLGGEPLFRTDVELFRRRFPPSCRLVNNLGSTEIPTYIQNVITPDTELDTTVVPVGLPVEGKRIVLVDEHGAAAPDGEVGEIVVQSEYLALGYWNDERATAERFGGLAGPRAERTYLTGDLGRRRPDGTIDFLGRRDDQIKVRGHRVEMGEVQFALAEAARELGEIEETTAAPVRGSWGATSVVAYVVPHAGARPDMRRLRELMAARLPDPMRPEAYVRIESMPRTRNGKIDRSALPRPERAAAESAGKRVVGSPVAVQLEELWRQLLALDRIPGDGDFFDLGGDSLLALELADEIERLFGRRLALPDLANASTLNEMVRAIERRDRRGPSPCLIPFKADGRKDPLFLVHGLGGGVIQMRELARRLDADRPVYAFQARGVDGVSRPLRRIESMAEAYMEELLRLRPRGPFLLGGFSMGGVVAYEMAQRLVAGGHRVDALVIIDSGAPLPLPWKERVGNSLLYGKIVWRRMRERQGGAARPRAYARRLNRVMLHNFGAVRRYRARPYAGREIHLIASRRDGAMQIADDGERELLEQLERRLVDRRSQWDRLAPGRVRTHDVVGHHLELWRPPALDRLIAAVRAILHEIGATRTAGAPAVARSRAVGPTPDTTAG